MPLLSKELLKRKTLKNFGTKALVSGLSASGISAAILSANREEKKLEKDSPDLKTKANIPRASYEATGKLLIPIPEKGRTKRKIYWTGAPVIDSEGGVKHIPVTAVVFPEGKHELSEAMKEYDTGKIDLTNLGMTTGLGASLAAMGSPAARGKNLASLGFTGAMSALVGALTASKANKYRRIADELIKDPNISETEKAYLEKRKKKNYLLPALTAATGLLGGATLVRAIRKL